MKQTERVTILAMLRALSLFLFLALGVVALAQSAADSATIYQIGKAAYDQNRAPGFSLAVYKGQAVFAFGYGYADLANKTLVTASTRFSVGSISMQFTAASILLLAEHGRLSSTTG